jgi:small-conductance mechanosensitive channel
MAIPMGKLNNEYIKNVSFSFSQVDYKITKVLFTDADKERFSVPEEIVPSLPDNDAMTISMSGF